MDVNIFERANQIIRSCDTAYIGVIDEKEFPSVSTISVIDSKNIFEVYFATGMNGNKARRLMKNARASVCCQCGNDNVTLVGECEVLTEQNEKSLHWKEWFINHFPLGETDPNYCVVKFTTKRVSLWIDRESAEFEIDEILKVQSRCGLLCDFCKYKESHGCGGCIETNGHPFYGECPIAECCQKQGYTHCGDCDRIPDKNCKSCEGLYAYSYEDPEHGDNPPGARIEMCKAWNR